MKNRVLIVDDEEGLCAALQDYLEGAGYDVLIANDISAARTQLDAGPAPDIVVVDATLPDGSGISFIKELKDSPDTNATPILLISAHSSTKLLADGALRDSDLLLKPFHLKDFLMRIKSKMRK